MFLDFINVIMLELIEMSENLVDIEDPSAN